MEDWVAVQRAVGGRTASVGLGGGQDDELMGSRSAHVLGPCKSNVEDEVDYSKGDGSRCS